MFFFYKKYRKQLLDTWIDSLKTASKIIVHKTGKYLGNKIADTVAKSYDEKIVKPDENSRDVEETVIPPKQENKHSMN